VAGVIAIGSLSYSLHQSSVAGAKEADAVRAVRERDAARAQLTTAHSAIAELRNEMEAARSGTASAAQSKQALPAETRVVHGLNGMTDPVPTNATGCSLYTENNRAILRN